MKIPLASLLLIVSVYTMGQDLTQTVRGKVVDKTSNFPLPGATVTLKGNEEYGAITDKEGKFLIGEVPYGRYILEVRFIGYEPYVAHELRINTAKEVVYNVKLEESPRNLEEVVVTGTNIHNELDAISNRTITVEETQRFAASFYDPARLVAAFPGVVTADDQGNNISIRGYSPNHLKWWLEGSEIVNPNHLTNTGTFSDKPAPTGGGVNILSAQMLANSNFLSGAFPPAYGNALSGIMDMKVRNGNNQQHEFIGQARLLGLDFAAEGPLTSNSRSSFLTNYRYSTVGFLTSLGVDFGDEAINFQDLSFNLSFPLQNGSINVFGMGGTSKNDFTGLRDSTEWEVEKDRKDIFFKSRTGAVGASFNKGLSENASIFSTVVYSGLEGERTADYIHDDLTLERTENFSNDESKLSWHTALSEKIGRRHQFRLGGHLVNHTFSVEDSERNIVFSQGKASSIRLAPYFDYQFKPGVGLKINFGGQINYHSLNEEATFEPRTSLKWNVDERNILRAAYGRYSQMPMPNILLSRDRNDLMSNLELETIKADQFIIGYYTLISKLRARMELYYHSLFDVPIHPDPGSTYSVLNELETNTRLDLANDGTGRNYGLDITVERLLENEFYFIFSSSLYESKYTGGDGIERDSRYNGNYAFNISSGKEFYNADKDRVLGINTRIYMLGGLRDSPVDLQASRQAGRTIYRESQAYTLRNEPYFRIDLRFSATKHKTNYHRMIALDIQNVANRRNDAYLYYDSELDRTATRKQLGIIPVLTYRVEF